MVRFVRSFGLAGLLIATTVLKSKVIPCSVFIIRQIILSFYFSASDPITSDQDNHNQKANMDEPMSLTQEPQSSSQKPQIRFIVACPRSGSTVKGYLRILQKKQKVLRR